MVGIVWEQERAERASWKTIESEMVGVSVCVCVWMSILFGVSREKWTSTNYAKDESQLGQE